MRRRVREGNVQSKVRLLIIERSPIHAPSRCTEQSPQVHGRSCRASHDVPSRDAIAVRGSLSKLQASPSIRATRLHLRRSPTRRDSWFAVNGLRQYMSAHARRKACYVPPADIAHAHLRTPCKINHAYELPHDERLIWYQLTRQRTSSARIVQRHARLCMLT